MEVRDLWPAAIADLGVLRSRVLIRMLELWELRLYRQANRVVTVTEAFRQNLISRGVPAAKVSLVSNGADASFWQPATRPATLARLLGLENKIIVLYIGAHGISQALDTILEVAQMLRDKPNIQFLFVGEGVEKEGLVRRASAAGLNNTQFLGSVDKASVRDYYALADICLVPLRDIPLFKTFIPSKMFEMMAMERPIVASVCGEAADILNRSGGAVVVPPQNAAAIVQSIRTLADDCQERARLGRQGRKFVIEHYSRETLAAKYIGAIEVARAEFSKTR